MKIAVIIPAFNPGDALKQTIAGVRKAISGGDIIVVDDGSTDNTAEIAREEKVILLSHPQNRGKGEALKTGFKKALELQKEAVITIDADGQHDPRFIPQFLRVGGRGDYDIIIGSRMGYTENMPFPRFLSNKITSFLVSWLAGQRIEDSQSGYRFIKTDVLRNISLSTSRYETESELLIKAGAMGYRIGAIKIDTIYGEQRSFVHPLLDTIRFVILILKCLIYKKEIWEGSGRTSS